MNPLPRATALAFLLCVSTAPASAPPGRPDWNAHPANRWVRQSPRPGKPVPGFVYEGSAAYDPIERKWIHHAGHDGIPQGFHTFTFDLDSRRWRQMFPPTSPPGVCCVDGGNTFDIANRRFVRFPGGSLGHGFQWSRGVRLKESAVWLYDLPSNKWTNMRPPPYKEPAKYSRVTIGGLNPGAVYDPNHEITFSFGGQSSGGGKNALWAYDAYSNDLVLLPAKNPPAQRDGMGMAYDARQDKLVMFGSQYLTDERTWLYDLKTNSWEALALKVHPPGKKVTKDYSSIPRMAYDSRNGIVLCVIWLGEKAHETWAFDTGARKWTKMNPATEPSGSKSRSRNLSYDAERDLFILETSGAKSNRPEVWTYRYRKAGEGKRSVAPTDLRVITEAGGKARLTWKGAGVRYEVERAQAEQVWKAKFATIGRTTGLSFEDKGLKTGQVYFYRVKVMGKKGAVSGLARTQPRVLLQPIVSVPGQKKVEVRWNRHPATDVVGYNLYRGLVSVRTVKKGKPTAWTDNDPEYAEPQMVQVQDIAGLKKLNADLLKTTTFTDTVDLGKKGDEAADYKYAVYAYIVRAVNRLGTESGPSPYALTIPSEPLNVLCREAGQVAELKWSAAVERGVIGYHVYKLKGTWAIERMTDKPIEATRFRHKAGRGTTRYWVVAVDALGQEGQPSSPAWFGRDYRGFYAGEWHQ